MDALTARSLRHVLASACVLSLACAETDAKHVQIDRARQEVKTLQDYRLPQDYRQQLDRYFATVLADSPDVMLAPPSGAIVCGHVRAARSGAGHVRYLPFGAIFDRAGSLRWARIFQLFEGMYATSASNPRPTDDDLAIAIACNIPLVF